MIVIFRNREIVFYIIKWLRFSKPVYYFGEMFQNENKLLPGPSEIYHSLHLILQMLKRKYTKNPIKIITMGFSETELKLIDQFRIGNRLVNEIKNIPKPLGKKEDGSLYRVFMVDHDFEPLKKIKEIIIPEHFEIVGIARNGYRAYEFFKNRQHDIDILIASLKLEDCTAYQLIEELKKINSSLITIILINSSNEIDYDLTEELVVNFHLKKPIIKEELIEKMKAMLS